MADTNTTAFERIVRKYRYAKLPRAVRLPRWRWRRAPSRPLQFSLKALLLLVTVTAMVIAAVVAANRPPPPQRPYVIIDKHVHPHGHTRYISYCVYFDGACREAYVDVQPLGTLNEVTTFSVDQQFYRFYKNEPLSYLKEIASRYRTKVAPLSLGYSITRANAVTPEMERRYTMMLAHVGDVAKKLRWGLETKVYLPMDYERPDPKLFLPRAGTRGGAGVASQGP